MIKFIITSNGKDWYFKIFRNLCGIVYGFAANINIPSEKQDIGLPLQS